MPVSGACWERIAKMAFGARKAGLAAVLCLAALGMGATALSADNPEDGEWRMAARDHASTRYSPLAQINAGNVKDLKVAFTFSTGTLRGHEAAPIVVGSTMYVVTPYPNYLYAIDIS